MWIDRLLSSKTTDAAELAARFAEHRQRVLAENVANLYTPDYHSRNLDPGAFHQSLKEALRASGPGDAGTLNLRGNAQFATDAQGRTVVRPAREPAPNALFHDGTNARLEQLMADAAKNGLTSQLATNLLNGRTAP